MKQIPLSNSPLLALVDDSDFVFVNQWKWKLHNSGHACRTIYKGNGKFSILFMHHLIGGKKKGKVTDHDNQNKLDNQRHNLLHVSKSRNNRNKGKLKTNTSGFLNVSRSSDRWRAFGNVNGLFVHLGVFDTPQEASVVAERFKNDLLALEVVTNG